MSSTQLAVAGVRQDGIISVASVRANRDAIQQLLKEVLAEGIDRDYASIPGTGKKKTLLKPGAEKICSLFGMAGEPIVEAIRDDEDMTYRVTVRFTSIASGTYLGSGVGEASTRESKYAWRAAVCDEEFEATDHHKRRIHWKKGYNGPPESVKQVREDPNDKMNTVLKMAKKRAQIDGVLTITAASDTFTQDLEGLIDKNAGKSSAPVTGAQVEAAMGEAVITQEQSRKFFGTWKNVGKHTKENVTLYLQRMCGGITDDRKMPARCYQDAIKWAATEGAPIPEAPKAQPAAAKPAATPITEESPELKKVKQLFDLLGYDLAHQAMLLGKFEGKLPELAIDLEMELERE
jgi:hypothetical protein